MASVGGIEPAKGKRRVRLESGEVERGWLLCRPLCDAHRPRRVGRVAACFGKIWKTILRCTPRLRAALTGASVWRKPRTEEQARHDQQNPYPFVARADTDASPA